MTRHPKSEWSKEAHDNLQKRIDKTAKKPNSYANKRKILEAMNDDFVRY